LELVKKLEMSEFELMEARLGQSVIEWKKEETRRACTPSNEKDQGLNQEMLKQEGKNKDLPGRRPGFEMGCRSGKTRKAFQ
ncbi:hypothetical protein KI387_041640, partial [Taxus chinensis]